MKATTEGESLKGGALSLKKRLWIKTLTWLKALRLQFYPMTFVAYTMGAFAAGRYGYEFNSLIFWLGYVWLFFLEAATVLLNEYFDYSADKNNRYFGPFTGGSRVLVDRLLTFSQIKQGIALSLGLALISLVILLVSLEDSVNAALLTSVVLTILALGYTVPPLKLSYHSLGEVTVGVTHSFAVIICGYLFMGGHISDQFPWLIGLPLFLAVLPSIILAGIPDYDSDKQAGKKTFAVRFGKKSAARLAMAFTWLASATLVAFSVFNVLPEAFTGVYYFAIPHAFLLSFFLMKYIYQPGSSKRIDSLMVMSLIYLIWFGLIPLINLS
jgi:1,4-dihydroxy-2-naphthoate octaprenyltransferase